MIEYEARGFDEAILRARAINDSVREQIKDALDDASETAEKIMLAKVPRSGEGGHTIAGSIGRTRVEYAPGGAGGGGFFEATVGPGDDAPEHLEFVLRGTGIYGPVGNLIRPGFGVKALAMDTGVPTTLFRMHAKGQRAQREWIDEAREAARTQVEVAISRIRV